MKFIIPFTRTNPLQNFKKIGYLIKKIMGAVLIFLFVAALFMSFLIRVETFRVQPHYHYQGDYNRDYLVAHHMVQYGEIPLTGPEGQLGPTLNSPFYYYFLAAILALKDDIVFLGFANVVLQFITLVVVYLLARSMFGQGTALIAFIIFGFVERIVYESNNPWQPVTMQLFANLSYLLLFLSYQKKNYSLLLLSIFIFLFSAVLHQSMFAVIPMFFLLIFLILRNQKRGVMHYGGVVLTVIGSLALLYFPLFLYFKGEPSSVPNFVATLNSVIEFSPEVVFQNLLSRSQIFVKFFFRIPEDQIGSLTPVFGLILLLSTLGYFLIAKRERPQKLYAALLVLSILQLFFIASLLRISPIISFPDRHFFPVFGLFVILTAEVINIVFSRKIILKVLKFILILLFLLVSSPDLLILIEKTIGDLRGSGAIRFFNIPYQLDPSVEVVKDEILAIQKAEQRQDLYFFQIHTYDWGYENFYNNETLWVPLEKELNARLTKVRSGAYRGYEPIGDNTYIFLRCQYKEREIDEKNECIDVFFNQYNGYSIVRKIYSQPPYSIHLTKRQNH